jgi:acetyl esterase/lipase
MGSENKIEHMRIAGAEPAFYMDEEVTFAQADAWFGHVSRDLRMDVIYPQTDKRKYPCIVWICGGGWSQVNKGAHMPYLADLARRGFVVASVDYRLAHEAGFPGALIDIKAAIRYLRAHAERYSIDAEKFGVMGESAGGYLTAMIGVTRGAEFEKGDYREYSSGVQAACPWYMPCDIAGFVKGIDYRLPFFDGDMKDEAYRRYINPACYVTPQAPPFLILHGDADETVPLGEGEMFYEALTAHGADARLIVLEGEGHAGPQFFQRPLWDIITEFFKEKLG